MSGTYSRSTIGAPQMGFSLDRASIEDGILTCHWHQARFELTSGSHLTYGQTTFSKVMSLEGVGAGG
jgi:nitrite reductase/ring-hydroxylating ferredoxin subunit